MSINIGSADWGGSDVGINGPGFSTANTVGLAITGDMDVRVKALPDTWTPASEQVFMSRWGFSGNLSWIFSLSSAGTLIWRHSGDGTTTSICGSSATIQSFLTGNSVAPGVPIWVRATHAVASGTITFYCSLDGVTWTQLGTTASVTAGVRFAGNASPQIGAQGFGSFLMPGRFYYAELRNGIAGTVVAAPSFQTANALPFPDPQGNSWAGNTGAAKVAAENQASIGLASPTDTGTGTDAGQTTQLQTGAAGDANLSVAEVAPTVTLSGPGLADADSAVTETVVSITAVISGADGNASVTEATSGIAAFTTAPRIAAQAAFPAPSIQATVTAVVVNPPTIAAGAQFPLTNPLALVVVVPGTIVARAALPPTTDFATKSAAPTVPVIGATSAFPPAGVAGIGPNSVAPTAGPIAAQARVPAAATVTGFPAFPVAPTVGARAAFPQPTVEGGPPCSDKTVFIDPLGGVHPLYVGDADMDAWSGRFMPPMLMLETTVPGLPGAHLDDVQVGPRDVLAPVAVFGQGGPGSTRRALRAFVRSLNPQLGDGQLQATAPDGVVRTLTCRATAGLSLDEKIGSTRSPDFQLAVVTFRAFDPYWYDLVPESGDFALQAPTPFFPFFPLALSSSNINADSAVDNPGDVSVYPVWVITGPGDTITLSNATTGQELVIPTSLAAGEQLVIDTRRGHKTVTLVTTDSGRALPLVASQVVDGITFYTYNAFGLLALGSALWPLAMGENEVTVEMADARPAVHSTGAADQAVQVFTEDVPPAMVGLTHTTTGHSFAAINVPSIGFGPGQSVMYPMVLSDGKVALGTTPLTNSEFEPTAADCELVVFDPVTQTGTRIVVPTSQGHAAAVQPGKTVGGTDVGGDLQLVVRNGQPALMFSTTGYYFGWDIPSVGLYPTIGFLEPDGAGGWAYVQADSRTADQLVADAGGLPLVGYEDKGGYDGNEAQDEISAPFPHSGAVAITHYFAPSPGYGVGVPHSGSITIHGADGAYLAGFQVPDAQMGDGTLLSLAPRAIESDPSSPLGDERFWVIYDTFTRYLGPGNPPQTGKPFAIQEYRWDGTTVTPVSQAVLSGEDTAHFNACRAGRDGTLYVAQTSSIVGFFGPPTLNVCVYFKKAGERNLVSQTPYDPATCWLNYASIACRPDYSLGAGTLQGFFQTIDIDPRTNAVLLSGPSGWALISRPDSGYATAQPANLLSVDQSTFETANLIPPNDAVFNDPVHGVSGYGVTFAFGSVAYGTPPIAPPSASGATAAMQVQAGGTPGVVTAFTEPADLFPVIPGHLYSLAGWFLADTGTPATSVMYRLHWYDQNKTDIGSDLTEVAHSVAPGAWTFIGHNPLNATGGTIQAPQVGVAGATKNAVFAGIEVIPNFAASGQAVWATGLDVVPAADASLTSIFGSCRFLRTVAQSRSGRCALEMSSQNAAAQAIATPVGAIPVTPGDELMLTGWFRADATATPALCFVRMDFYNASHVQVGTASPMIGGISGSGSGFTATDAVDSWTECMAAGLVPATAVSVVCVAQVDTTVATALHYLEDFTLIRQPYHLAQKIDLDFNALRRGTPITAIKSSGTLVTATVASTAGMTAGEAIYVGGVAGFATNNPNGLFTIAELLPGGTQFTYVVGTAPTGGPPTAGQLFIAQVLTGRYATQTWPANLSVSPYKGAVDPVARAWWLPIATLLTGNTASWYATEQHESPLPSFATYLYRLDLAILLDGVAPGSGAVDAAGSSIDLSFTPAWLTP